MTAVGDDPAGNALIAHFRSKGVNVSGIFRVKGWRTPTKRRFLAGWAHTVGQQVLRVDREPQSASLPEPSKKNSMPSLHRRSSARARACSFRLRLRRRHSRACPASFEKKAPCPSRSTRATSCIAYAKAGVTVSHAQRSRTRSLHHAAIGQDLSELARAARRHLLT